MADNVLRIKILEAIDVWDIWAQVESCVSKDSLISPSCLPDDFSAEIIAAILEKLHCQALLCSIDLCEHVLVPNDLTHDNISKNDVLLLEIVLDEVVHP